MLVYPFTLLRPWMLGIIGGVLTTLTLPPFGWWPLACPGIGLLYTALCRVGKMRSRFSFTFLWGAALYVPSLWWMTAFTLPGGIFVGLLEATITALTATVIINRSQNHVAIGLGTVSALMFADALRSLWPFGGLPLGGIDLGQANGLFAPIVGNFGRLGLVGAVSAVGVLEVFWLRGRGNRNRWAFFAPLFIGLLGVGSYRQTVTFPGLVEQEHSTVAIIQGGGPRGLLASPENARNTYLAHLAATKERLAQPYDVPDLVLWPENTVDSFTFAKSKEFEELRTLTGTNFSVGITEDGGTKHFFNAQVMISKDGKIIDRYDKVRRVPFGEYFPFRKIIEDLGLAKLPGRDATPGTTSGILKTADITYGVLISYEGFFDDRARNAVNAGAEVLLIPTNASSYKKDQLPAQQVAAAQLRALETHREVIQVGPTGYSALVTATGQVEFRTKLGARAVDDYPFVRRTDRTLYVRFNDAPALAIAGLLAITSVAVERRKRLPTLSATNGTVAHAQK
jgi:apolipoprotein N-acyltransferase